MFPAGVMKMMILSSYYTGEDHEKLFLLDKHI